MTYSRNQKGFTGIEVVLAGVAFMAVGAAGYFAYQVRTAQSADYSVNVPHKKAAQKDVSADPTANWQIYTSNDGFTVKYPSDWVHVKSQGNGAPDGIAPHKWASQEPSPLANFSAESSSKTVQDYAKNTNDSVLNNKSFTINGNQAYLERGKQMGTIYRNYYVAHNGRIVSLSFIEVTKGDSAASPILDYSSYAGIDDQIVNTIHFN